MVCILSVGYFGIFLGQTVFIDEDAILNFEHNIINKESNGWRTDIALGMTYFFSDPGLSHIWSLSRWWAEMFDNDVLGFHLQVLFFIWMACLVQYGFLRKIVPETCITVAVLISILIAFGSLRYEFLFFRSSTFQLILTPFVSFLLYDFLKKPLLRHYFYYTIILFLIAFAGSSTSFFAFLCFIGIFCIGIAGYHGWFIDVRRLGLALKRFFILNKTLNQSLISNFF